MFVVAAIFAVLGYQVMEGKPLPKWEGYALFALAVLVFVYHLGRFLGWIEYGTL